MAESMGTAAPPPGAAGPGKVSRWWTWIGAGLSVGLVATIVLQLGGVTGEVRKMLAGLPLTVWPALLLLYLVQPLCDLMVFRRLWNLPLAGFEALLRKTVINEVVLGYSGEAYLYVWARRAATSVAAPFQAIKDANIVSALLGNLATLALVGLSAPRLRDLDLDQRLGPALWSGLIPVAISVGLLVFGRRVFSLSPGRLLFVGCVHALRLVVTIALTVLIWRTALPQVSTELWLVLLAVRYLVSRIPLLSNKELVFGNLVLLLLGAHAPVAVLLAALALAMLFLHLAVIILLGVADLARGLRASSRATGDASAAETGATHD